MKSSSEIVITNKPTPTFTGQMPFLSPHQQRQSTEGNLSETLMCLELDLNDLYVSNSETHKSFKSSSRHITITSISKSTSLTGFQLPN